MDGSATPPLDPTAPDYKEQFKKRLAEEGGTVLHLSAIENPELNKEIITVDGIISSSSLSYYTPKTAKAWHRSSDGDVTEGQTEIPLNSEDNAKFVDAQQAQVMTQENRIPGRAEGGQPSRERIHCRPYPLKVHPKATGEHQKCH